MPVASVSTLCGTTGIGRSMSHVIRNAIVFIRMIGVMIVAIAAATNTGMIGETIAGIDGSDDDHRQR